ncbi:MAG TPA: glycosyltransferase family 39 protein [Kofleriaceae bacterium]
MRTRLVLIAGLVAWTACAVILWLGAAPLGHDEAQYAIAAQDLIAGTPPRWFYLSKGMNVVALPGALAGGSERALRVVPLVLAIVFALAVAHLAWRTVGARAAAWVVCVLAGMRAFTTQSSELLSDLPAATFLVLGTTPLVCEVLREDGPRWRVIIVGPLFAAAFYLRYASCVPIAIAGLVVVGVGWRGIARRPLPIVATGALFLGLLVPHFLAAMDAIGSPFGILLESQAVTEQWVGQGLLEYVTVNPLVFYGLLAPVVLIAGLLSLRRGADRRAIALWLIGVASIVGIGLTTHARARYIFYPLALLAILGTAEILRRLDALAPHIRRIVGPVLAAAVAVTWILVVRVQMRIPDHRRTTMAATLSASRVIRDDVAGRRCRVLAAHNTQLEHYTGCWGNMDADLTGVASNLRVYVVDDRSKHWAAVWHPDLATLPGKRQVLLESPAVTVYRLDPE